MKFTEKLNIRSCYYVKSLTYQQFRDKFWEEGYTDDQTLTYYKQVMRFCQRACDEGGTLDQLYKLGQGKDRGRMYVRGFGCQSLQCALRDLLVAPTYVDYDM